MLDRLPTGAPGRAARRPRSAGSPRPLTAIKKSQPGGQITRLYPIAGYVPALDHRNSGRSLAGSGLCRQSAHRREPISMHVNPYIVLGSAVVGLLVGLTGAGGGALMTPMLILLFGVKPSSAISSDLVAAVLMRPVGAAVHLRKGTVNLRMVGWMVIGSVPMAFVGAFLLHELGNSTAAQMHVEIALGAALLIGAGAMVLRYYLDRRAGHQRLGGIADIAVRPLPTIAIGAVGGLIVGMTSVGSGSLMIVLLLFLYPLIGASQLVGTDLTQEIGRA